MVEHVVKTSFVYPKMCENEVFTKCEMNVKKLETIHGIRKDQVIDKVVPWKETFSKKLASRLWVFLPGKKSTIPWNTFVNFILTSQLCNKKYLNRKMDFKKLQKLCDWNAQTRVVKTHISRRSKHFLLKSLKVTYHQSLAEACKRGWGLGAVIRCILWEMRAGRKKVYHHEKATGRW